MEHQLYREIVAVLRRHGQRRRQRGEVFSAEDIVRTWFWSVIHDRPVSWACERRNAPLFERSKDRPSNSTMSRRLRSDAVRSLLKQVEAEALRPRQCGLLWMIDGKPLAISGCSKDRQAGYGRAAGTMAKGYKLHAVFGPNFTVAAWRIAPMNKDERVMARRLLRDAPVQGYVLGDGNYDSNDLHDVCLARKAVQFVAPRRYGPGRGIGHRPQSPSRLRSRELLEGESSFGRSVFGQRFVIEQHFGHLTSWGGGLNGLPAWARTHRRVHRWVQAKLILTALKRRLPQRLTSLHAKSWPARGPSIDIRPLASASCWLARFDSCL